VQYLRTYFPNGTDNAQNQLMLGAGLVIKFSGMSRKVHYAAPAPVVVAPPPPTVAFTCGTNVANVPLGQMVQIFGDAKTEPEQLNVAYTWSSDGGMIEGTGSTVSINTTGMAIGDYRVKGHASVGSNPASTADCTTVFRVIAVEPPPAPTTTYVTVSDPAAKDEKLFHQNVKDAFFDVNSAAIRPDTQASINQAANYLIHVLISGWADPRGSVQFNLALGIKRAHAVQSALIAAKVPADQLEIISNGKSSQVCTNANKSCWQQNRRVSFTMKP
jgi:peptidoglycan-associated lipoprotein